jgi:hypothetical protein
VVRWCTPQCENARWPKRGGDTSGSCRTVLGLYCKKLRRMVARNGRCQVEGLVGDPVDGRGVCGMGADRAGLSGRGRAD